MDELTMIIIRLNDIILGCRPNTDLEDVIDELNELVCTLREAKQKKYDMENC